MTEEILPPPMQRSSSILNLLNSQTTETVQEPSKPSESPTASNGLQSGDIIEVPVQSPPASTDTVPSTNLSRKRPRIESSENGQTVQDSQVEAPSASNDALVTAQNDHKHAQTTESHTRAQRTSSSRPVHNRGPEALEKSVFGIRPQDEFITEVGDWIWGWMQSIENVEIEAKIGVLLQATSKLKERLDFPVATETIVTNDRILKFESNMSEVQHNSYNYLLNQRVDEQAHPGYQAAPIAYRHFRQADEFYSAEHLPRFAKIRVSRDTTTGNIVDGARGCVIKERIADMNVFCPKRAFDFRISVSTETPTPLPRDAFLENVRMKDRRSYTQQITHIDLTRISSPTVPDSFELEIEFSNIPLLKSEASAYERGEPNMYLEMIEVFINNIRLLIRNAHVP